MTTTQVIGDLLGRGVIIAMFLTASSLLQLVMPGSVAVGVELVTQSLLISFYCFEYKTAAACIDTPTGLGLFEAQWIYQMGFGFPTAFALFLTKQLGSATFFLAFPVLTVMSLDEQGQGLLLMRDDRKAVSALPCFTWTIRLKNFLLGKLPWSKVKAD